MTPERFAEIRLEGEEGVIHTDHVKELCEEVDRLAQLLALHRGARKTLSEAYWKALTDRDEAREELNALFASLPKCVGEWIGGSGGHCTFKPCGRYATYEDPDCIYRYACDEHRSIHKARLQDSDELPWADLVRGRESAAVPKAAEYVAVPSVTSFPLICEHRLSLPGDEDEATGPMCDKPARWLSCHPVAWTASCDDHACRCKRPIESARKDGGA